MIIFKKPSKPSTRPNFGVIVRKCSDCSETLRPCIVEGQRCLFHRFAEISQALLKINVFVQEREARRYNEAFKRDLFCPPGTDAEVLRNVYALIEYPDGTIGKVEPEKVRFLDKEVNK